MSRVCSLRDALATPDLLGGILDGDTWARWRALLIAAMGEPLNVEERALFTEVTGRDTEPSQRIEELWCAIGRRGGKSRAISVLAAYLATCHDYSNALVRGERGVLAVLSATTRQAEQLHGYISALFADKPMLRRLVKSMTATSVELHNDVLIDIRPANFRTIRSITAVAAIVDEVAFLSSEFSVTPDTELLNAIRPSLATTGGPLIAISSPYSRKGELWRNYSDHYGPNGDARILVAQAPSRVMNPSLPASVVERAYARDAIRAASEFGAEFRDQSADGFIDHETVAGITTKGLTVRPPEAGKRYVAFFDGAGGGASGDAAALAIAHREGEVAVLDALEWFAPPFSPEVATRSFAATLRSYGIRTVTGDAWGGQFPREVFNRNGIVYKTSDKSKAQIYLETLPLLNSSRVDLLDIEELRQQLSGLQRRAGRAGRDIVDHPTCGHDDICNAACGALALAALTPVLTPAKRISLKFMAR